MPADGKKSLTVQPIAHGNALRKTECRAEAIVTGCRGIAIIAEYRFSDAERMRRAACGPETRPAIRAGHCGTVPATLDRDHILLHYLLDPAQPAGRREYDIVPAGLKGSPAAPRLAGMMRW